MRQFCKKKVAKCKKCLHILRKIFMIIFRRWDTKIPPNMRHVRICAPKNLPLKNMRPWAHFFPQFTVSLRNHINIPLVHRMPSCSMVITELVYDFAGGLYVYFFLFVARCLFVIRNGLKNWLHFLTFVHTHLFL